MANWSTLKTAITDIIKTNGNQEITGQVLQSVLTSIVNSLGARPDFAGVATPTTAPGIFDGPIFFIAATHGAYPSFNNITLVKGEIAILRYNEGTWVKEPLLITTTEADLEFVVDLGTFNRAAEAEELAASYASNRNAILMRFKIGESRSGFFLQSFSNSSATIQFLYLDGSRYVREVSWGNGTVGAWKDITGSERIKGLSYNQENSILSFEDALSETTWGSVYLPLKETAAQEVAKIVANAPSDLDTLKEIADYIASDKTNAADVATAIAELQGGYGNLKDEIGDVQTALDEEVASSEQMYESLQNSITTAKNDMRSSTPIFNSVVTGEVTLMMGSATTNYTVVYLENKKVFAALNAGKYWANWLAWGKYPSAVSYGPAPAVGKIYIMGNALFVWDGSSLKEIGDFDDIKKRIDSNTGAIANNVQAIDLLAEEVATKAPKVGYAPDLKVDFAKELVGRGVAEPQEIGIIRPTGEISIGDGNATIAKVKGESVVWNQVYTPEGKLVYNGVTATTINGETSFEGVTVRSTIQFPLFTDNKQGHIYLFTLECDKTLDGKSFSLPNRGDTCVISNGFASLIHINSNTSLRKGIGINDFEIGETINTTAIVRQYDLTKMFGAGNEPITIEEFEARKPLGVSNEYNEGEIISYDAKELKSVGINAWDEEWEVGGLANGEPSNTTSQIRSKNFTPCVGGQDYYGYMGWSAENFLHLSLYDSDKAHIGNVGVNRKVVTLPANASYFKVFTTHECGYGNVYKGDICINLSHSGYRNGEYVPYEEDTLQLPDIKAIKDKEGNQLFPYGLLSAGSAHDEITATKAVKRVGVVDMGTLSFYLNEAGSRFIATIPAIKAVNSWNQVEWLNATKYNVNLVGGNSPEGVIGILGENVYVKDNTFTNPSELKKSLLGTPLYYELAEPIEVDLPEPLNLTYDAWDFGTEELIAEGATTPLNADIVYLFNAVDRIRENTENNKKLEKELAELKAQLTQLTQVSNGDGR